MSWFDTAGFVSVAKSALKEAQKTIDKALDIKEDEEGSSKSATPATVSTDKNESESFFSAWGVKGNASPDRTASILPGTQDSFSSSLWGSFTGSFFENPRSTTPGGEDFSSTISEQPKRSSISRLSGGDMDGDIDTDLALGDDRSMWEGFAKTQLVVESPLTSKEDKPSSSAPSTSTSEEVKWRRKERQSDRSQNRNSYPNRLSVISSESDKRSSDSVEILGSTSCTASPESDLPTSFSASSLASSAGLRPVSASSPDSVEVIPESSESYSVSVEVLGSRSSSASLSSPLEPTPDRPILLSPKDLTSPDSVEVVPEEEEDGSLADDSYASASASESTMTQATVLEPHGQVCSAMDSSTHFLEAIDSSGQVDIVTSSTSGRTDSSLSSLVLDSSTDTIHSDHSSVSRSNLQLTVTSDYPQAPKPLWLASSQSSCEKQIQENVSNKLLASPKKSSSKSRESLNRSSEKRDWKAGEIKLLSTDSPCEDTQGAVTDSSGEGTLMESSSEDTLPASDFPSQQSTSGYVKNLLADAMADDAAQLRMNSPVSLESRSEMGLRLGSEQTSGHTSGDELETTTSSDIEIISSPNGEGSSSTASRHSPAKLVHRGPHGHVDILKFPGKMKAHKRGLECGGVSLLRWLVILLGLLSYCDACSTRSPPRLKSPSAISTTRPPPNSEGTYTIYDCPEAYVESFCLNGGKCFEYRFKNSHLYNCFCAEGYWGNRCEFKGLDETYMQQSILLQTAGIASGAVIAVFLSFIVCACLYVHMKRRRERRRAGPLSHIPERRPFDKQTKPRDSCETIQLTSLA